MAIEIAVATTTTTKEVEEECLKNGERDGFLSLLLCFPAWFRPSVRPSFLPSLRSGGKLRRILHVKDERGAAAGRKGTKKKRTTKSEHPRGLGGEERERGRDGREGQWE